MFSSCGSEQPLFSSNNSEGFDDLDFPFDDTSLVQINLSTASLSTTPDFSTYSFGNEALSYSTPEPHSPSLYPDAIEQASHYSTNTHLALLSSRPSHLRSNTTTPYLHPTQPYVRRRSLSQGDADRIAAANTISNPTFVRLRAPRGRSTTSEEKKRGVPYAQYGRTASQGPGSRGRPLKQPKTLHGRHGSPLVDGMVSMPIGTPLDDVMEVEDSGTLRSRGRSSYYAQEAADSFNNHTQDGGPTIKRMTHFEDLKRSRHIVQIGVMATKTGSPNPDPSLQSGPSISHHERILAKLDEIEHHLVQQNGYNAEALRGCTMIREALAKKMGVDQLIEDEVESDTLDAPSTIFSEMGCSFMGGGDGDDGDELMKLLMQDNDRAICKVDDE